MNNLFRTLIAGYGAKKLGGGCFSTIVVFFLIYYALGYCGKDNSRQASPRTGSVIRMHHTNNVVASTTTNYKDY